MSRSTEAARPVGIIANLGSGSVRRQLDALREIAADAGPRGSLHVTRSLDELDEAVVGLRDAGAGTVAICGGDGTLHRTITALVRAYGEERVPRIVVVPLGTMSSIAKNLGLPRGRRAALDGLGRALAGGGARWMSHPVLRVGDRYGFMFGCGVFSRFMRAYYRTGQPSGPTAARLLARVAGSVLVRGELAGEIGEPLRVQVVCDGQGWLPTRFLGIAAATVEEIGLGFAIFRRGLGDPERFAALGLHSSAAGLVRDLPRHFLGRPVDETRATCVGARQLVIDAPQQRDRGFMIDGEVYDGPERITVELGPHLQLHHPVR